nr:hypothetical protein [Haladaptatus sp. R4]
MTGRDTNVASVPETFEKYAEVYETAGFTDWLRERAQPEWSEATSHQFTRELGTDDLDDEVFQLYLV